jgi:hypothetical protein
VVTAESVAEAAPAVLVAPQVLAVREALVEGARVEP